MPEQKNLSLAKGETLEESFVIDADWDSLSGCNIVMHLRKSHRGRIFAELSSANNNIGVRKVDGYKVSLWALGSELVRVPAAKYRYDIYAQCDERKVVLATGFFDLLPNLVNDCDLQDIGIVTPQDDCSCVALPTIASANRIDELCCQTCGEEEGAPLFYQVTSDAGLKNLECYASIGHWRFESFSEGKWVNDRSLSVESKLHRVVFMRFLEYPKGTKDWEKGLADGGSTCGDCNRDCICTDFFLKIRATDDCGNVVMERFQVTVDGDKGNCYTDGENFSLSAIGCNTNSGAAVLM